MKMLGQQGYVGMYGEAELASPQHVFYSEALTFRSARHNWQIQPHRHREIVQMFVLESGGCEARIDDKVLQVRAPAVLLIGQGQMHGFAWQIGSTGRVLSVASALLSELTPSSLLHQLVAKQCWQQLPASAFSEILTVCQALKEEENSQALMADAMIGAQLQQLLILLLRQGVEENRSSSGLRKSRRKLERFKQLVSEHASQQHQVSWYAAQIGVSASHLNQICQAELQVTALKVIHQQLFTEAQRLLLFSDMPVTQVADRLGFDEPAYFARFFKRHSGDTATEFRHRQHF
ncbi:helix-turn-helix domain-containing protein [Salinimonas lutimaris]|uniref:helix-turn-helix domain-containing protein n=1 Tax=Salinimonas lutimaris TaxID=914153 RepID=UPI0010BF7BF4|nr:helix-turn-helix domain-containing protein [Salinimonas lutimaris]